MKFSIIFIVLLLVLSPVYAEEEEVVDAGITPDSGLYFLDTFMDNMRLAFAAKGESKIKMQLDIAEERLAEVNAMALKGDVNAMMKAEKNHERIFLKLQNEVRVEEGVEVGEEVRNRFEHHNTEVKRI
jgi:hypothetical protein